MAMESKVLCPSLPDLLRKTVLTFCEGSVKFDKCLEVIGSLHIRSDSERVVTFMVDEQILRLGDDCDRAEPITEDDKEDGFNNQTLDGDIIKHPPETSPMPKKSRKISRPIKKTASHCYEDSDNDSELECMPSDHLGMSNYGFTKDGSQQSPDGTHISGLEESSEVGQVIHTIQNDRELLEHRSFVKSDTSQANMTPVLEVSSTKPDYTPPRLESRSSSAQEQSHESLTSPPVLERMQQDEFFSPSAQNGTSADRVPHSSGIVIPGGTSPLDVPVKIEGNSDVYPIPQMSPVSLALEAKSKHGYPEHSSEMPLGSSLFPMVSQAGLMGDIQSQLMTGFFPMGAFPMPNPMQALYSANMHKFHYTCNQMQILKDMLPKEGDASKQIVSNPVESLTSPTVVKPDLDAVPETKNPSPPSSSTSSNWEKLVSCPLCSKKLKSHRMLQLHMNSAHTHKLVYPCKQCDKVFYARSSLHSHAKRAHTPSDQRLKCLFCPRDYAFQSELNRHMELAHGRSQASIASLRPPVQGEDRMKLPPPPPPQSQQATLGYNRGGNTFNRSFSLGEEDSTQTRPSSTGDMVPYDQQRYPQSPDRQSTLVRQDSGQPDTTEPYNSQLEQQSSTEDYPSENTKQETSPDLYSMKFSCHICGTALKSKECLALHINAKHTQKHAYPCKICGKVFYAPSSRFCHMKRVHTAVENKFKCNYCWKVFTFHYELRKHMQIMHRAKMLESETGPAKTS